MEEESDRFDSGSGRVDVGSGTNEDWSMVGVNNDRKRRRHRHFKTISKSEETDSDHSMGENATEIGKQMEEYKVLLKLAQEGLSFGQWNPIQLIKSINKMIGGIKSARIL